jgi:DNA polymerase-3 subunit gamma/tau
LWQQILEAVGRASPFTRTYLIEARPIDFERGVLTVGFDPEFADQLDLVNNARTHALLQTKLKELGHPDAQIKFVRAEAPAPPLATPPPPAAPAPAMEPAPQRAAPAALRKSAPIKLTAEEFKNDPLIQRALELFKGTIVEVRT